MTARTARRRGGATVAETALLMSLFLMILFGLFEYARYLFALHVATNACRDAARYASVNVDKRTDFDYRDQTVGTRTFPSVWKYTTQRMGGADRMIRNMRVSAFPCDSDALFGTAPSYAPVVTPKLPPVTVPVTNPYQAPTILDYQNGTALSPANRVFWNSAAFTERIAVRITGTYEPVLPSFLFMSALAGTDQFVITMLGGSEG
jgi:Flp pilus assembly protein TadG